MAYSPTTSWQLGCSGNPDTPPLTPTELQTFLDFIADAHSITYAANKLGRRRSTFREIADRDPAFSAAWQEAIKARGDWWEDQHRAIVTGDTPPAATVACIVGLKMTGRFIEPQYQQRLQVTVNVNTEQLQRYSVEELEAMLQAVRDKALPVIEGESRQIGMGPGKEDKDHVTGNL